MLQFLEQNVKFYDDLSPNLHADECFTCKITENITLEFHASLTDYFSYFSHFLRK